MNQNFINNSLKPENTDFSRYPTPCHIYYESDARADALLVKEGLSKHIKYLSLIFSVKTCPLPSLLRMLLNLGWCLEVVNIGDLTAAKKAGAKGDQLFFSGAGWSQNDVSLALREFQIRNFSIDSLGMAKLFQKCLTLLPEIDTAALSIGIRIHDGDSHFGIPATADALTAVLKALPASAKLGLHIHKNNSGSPTAAEELAEDFKLRVQKVKMAAKILSEIGAKICFYNLGGSIDSPWVFRPNPSKLSEFHDPGRVAQMRNEHPLPHFDLQKGCEIVSRQIESELGTEAEIFFELGRCVATRALATLIEVHNVKEKLYPDGDIIITNGNSSILGPLHRGIHPVVVTGEKRTEDSISFIYGNLPHSGDWLFYSAKLPKLSLGDRLLIHNTGAYFLSLESNFGLPRPPIFDGASGACLKPQEEIAKLY